MVYETEQVKANDLSPAYIVEARGDVIYRSDIDQVKGATLRVSPIEGAEIGNELRVRFEGAGGIGQGKVILNGENLGKNVDFQVRWAHLHEGDRFTAQYFLKKGDVESPSPETNYELKD